MIVEASGGEDLGSETDGFWGVEGGLEADGFVVGLGGTVMMFGSGLSCL
jgi:hypothetical protein